MDRLTALGTGNAAVTRCYNTCFLLELPQGYLLCDAGGGHERGPLRGRADHLVRSLRA